MCCEPSEWSSNSTRTTSPTAQFLLSLVILLLATCQQVDTLLDTTIHSQQTGDFAMPVDFTLAIEFAQISAKRCAKRYGLDYDVCLSEAYLAISSRLSKFDAEKTKLSTYIYTVVTNQIIDYLRSECLTARAKRTSYLPEDSDVGCLSSFQDDDADVAARLALSFAESGSQTRTIRRKVESELSNRGWSRNRIEDAFEAVAEGCGGSSFIHS